MTGNRRVTERRPRLDEVAALAGTSTITVSRALRQPGKVAPATLERVMGAVRALGYVPNLAASSLASRRSGIVAVLVPAIGNPSFAETVQGIADAARPRGLQLLLGDYAYSDAQEQELLRAVAGRQPEAVVVIGLVRDPDARALLRAMRAPVVETWDLSDNPVDMVVGFSNSAAGAAMARHMLQRGSRYFAFVGGNDVRATARAEGFAGEIAAAGCAPPIVERVIGVSIAEGRRALARILARAPRTEAIFFATDVLAVGALLECQSRGIAVPGRLALGGLGDLEMGRELQPALTTVSVGAYDIGHRAGVALLSRFAGDTDVARIVDLGFTLIARDST